MKKILFVLIGVLCLSISIPSFAAKAEKQKENNFQNINFYEVTSCNSDNYTNVLKGGQVKISMPGKSDKLTFSGEVSELKADTKYFLWIRDLTGYTGDSLAEYEPLGYFKLLSFMTDENGKGSFEYSMSSSDLPANTYQIQVAINEAEGDEIGCTVVATKKYTEVKFFPATGNTCTSIQSGTLLDSADEVINLGFDQWGYNYQGRIFNGFFDNYSRPGDLATSGDLLSMKWNDAWLSNKSCDGDNKLDRHYGFDSYIGSGAWLTNHQSGSYQGDIISWNVSGTWLLDFASGTDNRQFRDLVQDEDGTVTGDFYWWSNEQWLYGGTLFGNVTGDTLTLHYERPLEFNYNGDFTATISEAGLIGTFEDSHGNELTWTADGVDPGVYETCDWNYFVKIIAVPSGAYRDGPANIGTWYTSEVDGIEIGPDIWGEFAIIQEVSNDTCTGDHGLIYKSPVRAGLGNW